MAKTEEKNIRRTKDQIEEDRKTIVETITNDTNITSLTELIMVLETQKGIILSEYQVKSTLGEEKDEILKILRIRKNVKKMGKGSDNIPETAGTENETDKPNFKKTYTNDEIWTLDASTMCPPREMELFLKTVDQIPTLALTDVTLFEIFKLSENDDLISKGVKMFLEYYLSHREKFISVKTEHSTDDFKKLPNSARDDLLVETCKKKGFSLITSDRIMAVKASFIGCQINYIKKSGSGYSIPALLKVGENLYFRGTSTSDTKYSIPGKDTSTGYTPVEIGDFLYVGKKAFISKYLVDVDGSYCLLFTTKYTHKTDLPEEYRPYAL